MKGARRLFLRNDLREELAIKFEEEIQRKEPQVFQISLKMGKFTFKRSGKPDIVLFREGEHYSYCLEVYQGESEKVLVQSIQVINLPLRVINKAIGETRAKNLENKFMTEITGRIVGRYATVEHFLEGYGYDSDAPKPTRTRDQENQKNRSEDIGFDTTDWHGEEDVNRQSSTDREDQSPDRVEISTERIQRNQQRSNSLKKRYDYQCQVCGDRRMQAENEPYAECHHLIPLGTDDGPDSLENMVVLCPNHHTDFDNGVIRVNPDNLQISHLYEKSVEGQYMNLKKNHNIRESLLYHNQNHAIL